MTRAYAARRSRPPIRFKRGGDAISLATLGRLRPPPAFRHAASRSRSTRAGTNPGSRNAAEAGSSKFRFVSFGWARQSILLIEIIAGRETAEVKQRASA